MRFNIEHDLESVCLERLYLSQDVMIQLLLKQRVLLIRILGMEKGWIYGSRV